MALQDLFCEDAENDLEYGELVEECICTILSSDCTPQVVTMVYDLTIDIVTFINRTRDELNYEIITPASLQASLENSTEALYQDLNDKGVDTDVFTSFNAIVETPSEAPSLFPTVEPTSAPTTNLPSGAPSSIPSLQPSSSPSQLPSDLPSIQPSSGPSSKPSQFPSLRPSQFPSSAPSDAPSVEPSSLPSGQPSSAPSMNPTIGPSISPSFAPTLPAATRRPTTAPTAPLAIDIFVAVQTRMSVVPEATRDRRRELLDCDTGLSDQQRDQYQKGTEAFLCADFQADLNPETEYIQECSCAIETVFCIVENGVEYFIIDFSFEVVVISIEQNVVESVNATGIQDLISASQDEYITSLAAAGVDMSNVDSVDVTVEASIKPVETDDDGGVVLEVKGKMPMLVGVGAGCGVALIALGLLLYFRRKRKLREAGELDRIRTGNSFRAVQNAPWWAFLRRVFGSGEEKWKFYDGEDVGKEKTTKTTMPSTASSASSFRSGTVASSSGTSSRGFGLDESAPSVVFKTSGRSTSISTTTSGSGSFATKESRSERLSTSKGKPFSTLAVRGKRLQAVYETEDEASKSSKSKSDGGDNEDSQLGAIEVVYQSSDDGSGSSKISSFSDDGSDGPGLKIGTLVAPAEKRESWNSELTDDGPYEIQNSNTTDSADSCNSSDNSRSATSGNSDEKYFDRLVARDAERGLRAIREGDGDFEGDSFSEIEEEDPSFWDSLGATMGNFFATTEDSPGSPSADRSPTTSSTTTSPTTAQVLQDMQGVQQRLYRRQSSSNTNSKRSKY